MKESRTRERVPLMRGHRGPWCGWRRRKSLHLLIKQGRREEVRHGRSPVNFKGKRIIKITNPLDKEKRM